MGKSELSVLGGDWPGRVDGCRGTRGGTSLRAGTSREARLCGDALGERERAIKTTAGESPSPLESIGSFATTRLRCHGL